MTNKNIDLPLDGIEFGERLEMLIAERDELKAELSEAKILMRDMAEAINNFTSTVTQYDEAARYPKWYFDCADVMTKYRASRFNVEG